MAYGITTQTLAAKFNGARIQATVTDAVGPVEYLWYRSTVSGFTPGAGNLLSGQESSILDDSTGIPNTIYYYVGRSIDTGNSNQAATATELAVTTASQSQSMNQFAQSPTRGQPDQMFNGNTISCLIDPAFVGTLYPGSPVKRIAASRGSAPVVTAVTAETDEVFGFITFDIKNPSFVAGMGANVSIKNNVLYLYATETFNAGTQLQVDLLNNGVKVADDAGDTIVGWAFDDATATGQLVRVYLETPSFRKAT